MENIKSNLPCIFCWIDISVRCEAIDSTISELENHSVSLFCWGATGYIRRVHIRECFQMHAERMAIVRLDLWFHVIPTQNSPVNLTLPSMFVRCDTTCTQGRTRIFMGGGGRKRPLARTYIKSEKPEVPYGRGPGPA